MEIEDYSESFHQTILLFNQTGTVGLLFGILTIFLLLFCSALISGSEVAYFSLSGIDLDKLRKSKRIDDKQILKLIDEPGHLLATILITNNFINITIIILSAFVLEGIIPEGSLVPWLQFVIEVVSVTFFLVFFGEISPKIYANLHNLQLARFLSRPLAVLSRFLSPISKIMVKSTNYFEKKVIQDTPVDMGTIGQAIEITVRDEQATKEEAEILKGIVYFSNVTVKQAMTTRVDVVAVKLHHNFKEILELATTYNFSRMPVYDQQMDHITGIIYVKDLIPYLNSQENFRWQDLIQDPYFVLETEKVGVVLEKFKKEKVHIAIVVGEYGGTAGIITLEDILEEVIGEIKDEFDEEEEIGYQQLDEYRFVFEGRTMLNDVCRIMNLDPTIFDEERGDADSIAGFILGLARGIPKQGAIIDSNEFRFSILATDERRIKKVIITQLNKS